MRFRPMLVGEVARIAGDPRETIRTRLKQGVFNFNRPKGWKRFSDFETIIISVHSRLMKATQDRDFAQIGHLLAAKVLMDEWQEDEKGVSYFAEETFMRDRVMIFWRDQEGNWSADIYDAPDAAQEEINNRISESYSATPVFTFVNLGAILRLTLREILKVQIERESKQDRSGT